MANGKIPMGRTGWVVDAVHRRFFLQARIVPSIGTKPASWTFAARRATRVVMKSCCSAWTSTDTITLPRVGRQSSATPSWKRWALFRRRSPTISSLRNTFSNTSKCEDARTWELLKAFCQWDSIPTSDHRWEYLLFPLSHVREHQLPDKLYRSVSWCDECHIFSVFAVPRSLIIGQCP